MRQLRDDREAVPLDAGDRALLDFVTKLTFSQQSMEPRDLDALRAQGFADLQVLEIATLAGFFNFITRVADARASSRTRSARSGRRSCSGTEPLGQPRVMRAPRARRRSSMRS